MTLLTVMIFGCSVSIEGSNYKQLKPAFDIEAFFAGKVKAWGIVQNRLGEVVQRFEVNIEGVLKNEVLTLDETFTYAVGEGPEKRVWILNKNANGTYAGSASDISGTAVGTEYGNAFNFQYEMDLAVGDSHYRVKFDDWFFSFDKNNMMNRSYIKKFGVVMAEVTIFMQKQS